MFFKKLKTTLRRLFETKQARPNRSSQLNMRENIFRNKYYQRRISTHLFR
jgi:lysozyme family protein